MSVQAQQSCQLARMRWTGSSRVSTCPSVDQKIPCIILVKLPRVPEQAEHSVQWPVSWLDYQGTRIRFTKVAEVSLLSTSSKPASVTQPSRNQWIMGSIAPEVKQSVREVSPFNLMSKLRMLYLTTLSPAKIIQRRWQKNGNMRTKHWCNDTFTPPHVFMAWRLIKHRDSTFSQ